MPVNCDGRGMPAPAHQATLLRAIAISAFHLKPTLVKDNDTWTFLRTRSYAIARSNKTVNAKSKRRLRLANGLV
jgi:hypothetical protein